MAWFKTLDESQDLPRGDVALHRVLPFFYLVSVVIFPVAFALAVLRPWGVPYWIWALVAGATGVGLRSLASHESDSQGRSPDGLYAFRAWCWLLAGGGTRQALRAIAVNRRCRSRS